jgi:hypothetical protein
VGSLNHIWSRSSFGRIILITLLLCSIVPIVIFSALSIQQNATTLTKEAQTNLQLIAESQAGTIELKLKEVLDTTTIATLQVGSNLDETLPASQIQEKLAQYRPDARNILGLNTLQSGQPASESDRSNVYWNNRISLSDHIANQIVLTEKLDPVFRSIKHVSPESQWIYYTSPEGMMRLYPWSSNDHYPDDWDPRETLFYTIADPAHNPTLQPRWTPPYVDFAGAGWMVTLSMPVVDKNKQFRGVMSQDVTIRSLKQIALNIHVLDGAGYGFLIDKNGGVIAHPDYQPIDSDKGTQTDTNALQVGTDSFHTVIRRMMNEENGFGYFVDEHQNEQLLVYASIPTIGWRLGIVVPRVKVVELATSMQNRGLTVALLMIIASILVSIFFTRLIQAPLLQLLEGVQHLSKDSDGVRTVEVKSFIELNRLAQSFNDMAAKVKMRETKLKARVTELSIEIDAQHQTTQVDALAETDFFKRLELNAERLRDNLKRAGTT